MHAPITEPNKFALVSKAASSAIAVPFSKAAAVKRMNIEDSTGLVVKRTKPLLKIPAITDEFDENNIRQGHRPYQPEVKAFRRGSKKRVLEILAAEGGREAILKDLLANVYSRGSESQRCGAWNTWCEFYRAWFVSDDYLPLTPHIVYCIASCFRAGGYRKFDNHMSIAVQRHIEDGHTMTDQLRLAQKRAARAVARGQGPSSQAAVYSIYVLAEIMADVPDLMAPLFANGPLWPYHLMVIAAYFLLREIEVAAAQHADIMADHAKKTVVWSLPVSKTDARAHGCQREWRCICKPGTSRFTCPCCLLLDLDDAAKKRYPDAKQRGKKKIFATSMETMTTKNNVIKSMQLVIDRCGEVHADHAGLHITGHSPRRAGAQRLAKLGLEVPVVQLLARLSIQVVLQYVAEAPLPNSRIK